MLRTETVETGTLDLIKELMADEQLANFNLVGGTALALKIGRRKSIDIDLFSTEAFDAQAIAGHLTKIYNGINLQTISNGVFGFINDVKVDILAHQYPLVGPVEVVEGVRMVSLQDIGAMKLNAIFNNGTRLKDFVDMYALLEFFPLEQLLQACAKKYPDMPIPMVKNSLIHHEDIQFLAPIDYIGPQIEWSAIAERLKKAVLQPHLTFSELPELTRKLLKRKQDDRPQRKRGRGI